MIIPVENGEDPYTGQRCFPAKNNVTLCNFIVKYGRRVASEKGWMRVPRSGRVRTKKEEVARATPSITT